MNRTARRLSATPTALSFLPTPELAPRPGFELLGNVVASLDVLSAVANGGWTVGDVLARHLINRDDTVWQTDLEIPGSGYVRALTLSGGGLRPTTYLSIDGEKVLPSGRRIAPAVSFSFVEGATPEEIARARGRVATWDRFGQEMNEA